MNGLTDALGETAAKLSEFRPLSYPKIAAKLGYPRSAIGLLSDVAHGRFEHISDAKHDDLRQRLGLPPVPVTIPASPCPTCHVVHGDGYDCHGSTVRLVRRKAPRRIQDMPVKELTWRIEHREEIIL